MGVGQGNISLVTLINSGLKTNEVLFSECKLNFFHWKVYLMCVECVQLHVSFPTLLVVVRASYLFKVQNTTNETRYEDFNDTVRMRPTFP